MPLLSDIESFLPFLSNVATIKSELSLEEAATVDALTYASVTVTLGVEITDAASTELQALLPSMKTAITNANAKADGWLAAIKKEIEAGKAWLQAHPIVANTALSSDGKMTAKMFHIS